MNTPRLSENTVNLIRDLALAFGPSGMEDGAAEVIRAEAEKIPGMAVSRDPLGSVILHLDRSAPGVPGKKLLFTAGMDEQSFMLTERTGGRRPLFPGEGSRTGGPSGAVQPSDAFGKRGDAGPRPVRR